MYIKLPFLRLEDVYRGNIFTDYMAAVAKLTVRRMSSDEEKYNPRVPHEKKKYRVPFVRLEISPKSEVIVCSPTRA